jgi:hypothetical protein
MDHHVRAEVVQALRDRGVHVLTAFEDHHRQAADSVLLDRATELAHVLFSQDRDLLIEAAKRQCDGRHFAGVIYAHQLGLMIGQCIDDLELLCVVCNPLELSDRVIYLPL